MHELSALQERIRTVLENGPPLRLAVLFGSAARDRLHAGSDVDLGIVPRDPDLPLSTELTLQAKLEAACGRSVDLVRLDCVSTLLRWEAAKAGVAIVIDDPHTFSRFVADAALDHADLMTTLAPAAERFRQRVGARPTAPRVTAGGGVTDPILLLQKLATLRDHVDRARRRRPSTLEVLEANLDMQDALAMSLFVAVQQATDIAFHISSDEGWGVPSSYVDGFTLLARNGVIDTALAGDLARAVSVRNRIAHGYASIDLDRLWADLPSGLDALDRYTAAIARFIGPMTL
jgi:uncharacterized protein YutE (UPF0331/DUF86 family)/predicted nucleotidyltransferase